MLEMLPDLLSILASLQKTSTLLRKPHCDTTSHPFGWLLGKKAKKQKMRGVSKDMENAYALLVGM